MNNNSKYSSNSGPTPYYYGSPAPADNSRNSQFPGQGNNNTTVSTSPHIGLEQKEEYNRESIKKEAGSDLMGNIDGDNIFNSRNNNHNPSSTTNLLNNNTSPNRSPYNNNDMSNSNDHNNKMSTNKNDSVMNNSQPMYSGYPPPNNSPQGYNMNTAGSYPMGNNPPPPPNSNSKINSGQVPPYFPSPQQQGGAPPYGAAPPYSNMQYGGNL